jgi:hypothetical protein
MDGEASAVGLVRALEGRAEPAQETEPEYLQSCHVYAHEPPCGSYLEHLRRLTAERDATGGEAQLKAKCGFWERLKR